MCSEIPSSLYCKLLCINTFKLNSSPDDWKLIQIASEKKSNYPFSVHHLANRNLTFLRHNKFYSDLKDCSL